MAPRKRPGSNRRASRPQKKPATKSARRASPRGRAGQQHRCSVCGSTSHRLETCPERCASLVRALQKKVKDLQQQRSRYPRRKSVTGPKSTGSYRAHNREAYLGKRPAACPVTRDGTRQRKLVDGSRRVVFPADDKQAVCELHKAGYLNLPTQCPGCGSAVSEEGLLLRCQSQACRRKMRAMSFSKLRFGSMPPTSAWKLIHYWTRHQPSTSPRSDAAATLAGVSRDPTRLLFKSLRAAESFLGRKEASELQLSGTVEADAHCLRKTFVSAGNAAFAQQVQQWKWSHPGHKVPKAFLLHFRVAALAERDGRTVVWPLPATLVKPGSPPPPESVEDLRQTPFFTHSLLGGDTVAVHTDGCHAWRLLCEEAGVPHAEVNHRRNQFTRTLRTGPVAPGTSVVVGTQCIDRRWREMHRFAPATLKVKECRGGGMSPTLSEYVWSWAWRYNRAGKDLWTELGAGMADLP